MPPRSQPPNNATATQMSAHRRHVTLGWLIGTVLVVLIVFSDVHGGRDSGDIVGIAPGQGTPVTAATPGVGARFPVSVSLGERHLRDAAGGRFLLTGDSAWSLIGELTREDAELYLDDRRARGFNAILVSLIEYRFARNAPANAYGVPPFARRGAFDEPNEAYFDHADWVIRRAAEKGLLVLLAPAYIGNVGHDEGWYGLMEAAGVDKLARYGRYLGRRYHGFENILWVHGGDANPADKRLVRAIAEGIKSVPSRQLHTAHAGPGTAALEYWAGEPWLELDTVYAYDNVHKATLRQFARPERLPIIMIESRYENEHGISPKQLRAQAYHAMLAGAAGQVFGNNPIWHFSGPGLFPVGQTWQQALDSPGARAMSNLAALLSSIAWWRLSPDVAGVRTERLFADPVGRFVSAARGDDRSIAAIYLDSASTVAVDLSQLAGPRLRVRWFDPVAGLFHAASRADVDPSGVVLFRVDRRNSGGDDDWVLLLERQEEPQPIDR